MNVPGRSPGVAAGPSASASDEAKQVADALADLHDPMALRKHPLARRSGASALQAELAAAIEVLRPSPQVQPSDRAWRRYHLLTLRYVEALDPAEVARRLAVSRSQYYREQEVAVSAVAEILREKGWIEGPPPSAAADPAPGSRLIPASGRALAIGAIVLLMVLVIGVAARATLLSERPVAPALVLSIYAGDGKSGYVNGAAAVARFSGPFGLAVDRAGTVFVADTGNHRIRRISNSGLVLDAAGTGVAGYRNGPTAEAQFSSPNAVAVGPDGTVYVGDAGNLRIRAISPSGTVSTLAGSGQAGYVDGVGTAARFASTGAIIVGPDGTLYVPDRDNNVVRKVTRDGVVSTYAGTGHRAHVDGPRGIAEFNAPQRGGGADAAGNVYVLDTGDNGIRKIAPDGSVSTVAGTGQPGFRDGPADQALFSTDILGVIANAQGDLFVMDAGNHRVRKISSGSVSTLFEFTDPDQAPGNIKLDPAGDLFLSDRTHNLIYKLTFKR